MLINIEKDVYHIADRLKEIDKNLTIKYNTCTGYYEVHGIDVMGDYILAKFEELDARVVTAVRKGYFIAHSYGHPYRILLHEQEHLDEIAEYERQKRIKDIEYGIKHDLKYAGKVVVNGATF